MTEASCSPDILATDWPSLELLEERYIRRVMAHVRGNKVEAAKLLRIDRRTLYYKLDIYKGRLERRCST